MHYYRYFEEVAVAGSFTKAAKNLHMSQQSLSEHIRRMEEHYGIKLFERKPSLHLTHAGELLLEHIRQSIYREEKLLADFSHMRSHQKGRIRVGITPTRAPIFFPPIFSRFNKIHPLVELSLREDHTSYLVKGLMDGQIDFLIGLEETGVAQNPSITSNTLLRDRAIYFIASRKLLIKCGFPEHKIETALVSGVELEEIRTVPIVLKLNKSKIHAQIAQEYLKLKVKPRIVVDSSNVFSMLPLCSAGHAGLFMSSTILRYVKENYSGVFENVVAFPMVNIQINCDIALMHFYDKPISVHFSDFIDATKNIFDEYAMRA